MTLTLQRVFRRLRDESIQSIDWVGLRDGGKLGTSRTGKVYTITVQGNGYLVSRSLVVGSFVIGLRATLPDAYKLVRQYERDTL